jgi:hypothetical protein
MPSQALYLIFIFQTLNLWTGTDLDLLKTPIPALRLSLKNGEIYLAIALSGQ